MGMGTNCPRCGGLLEFVREDESGCISCGAIIYRYRQKWFLPDLLKQQLFKAYMVGTFAGTQTIR